MSAKVGIGGSIEREGVASEGIELWVAETITRGEPGGTVVVVCVFFLVAETGGRVGCMV